MVRDPSIVSPSLTGVFIGGGHNKHGTGSRCTLPKQCRPPSPRRHRSLRVAPIPACICQNSCRASSFHTSRSMKFCRSSGQVRERFLLTNKKFFLSGACAAAQWTIACIVPTPSSSPPPALLDSAGGTPSSRDDFRCGCAGGVPSSVRPLHPPCLGPCTMAAYSIRLQLHGWVSRRGVFSLAPHRPTE